MSWSSSWAVFQTVLDCDRQLAAMGMPRGWYVRFHYWGRLCDRLNRLAPIEPVTVNLLGRTVQFPLSAPYAGMAEGILLDREYAIADYLEYSPQTILDLGANIGLGALYFHCQFPAAAIACVEPDPRNLPLLQQTLDLNQISATVVNGAIGATAGELTLRYGRNPACSALETSPMHQLEHQMTVSVQTIPQLLDALHWERIDLLKIDIEGTEDELLSQNNDWLERVGTIVLEIHPNTTPDAIASYLKPYGFQLSRQPTGREPVFIAQRVPSTVLSAS